MVLVNGCIELQVTKCCELMLVSGFLALLLVLLVVKSIGFFYVLVLCCHWVGDVFFICVGAIFALGW